MIIKLVFLRAENLINVVYYILPTFIIALVQKYTHVRYIFRKLSFARNHHPKYLFMYLLQIEVMITGFDLCTSPSVSSNHSG